MIVSSCFLLGLRQARREDLEPDRDDRADRDRQGRRRATRAGSCRAGPRGARKAATIPTMSAASRPSRRPMTNVASTGLRSPLWREGRLGGAMVGDPARECQAPLSRRLRSSCCLGATPMTRVMMDGVRRAPTSGRWPAIWPDFARGRRRSDGGEWARRAARPVRRVGRGDPVDRAVILVLLDATGIRPSNSQHRPRSRPSGRTASSTGSSAGSRSSGSPAPSRSSGSRRSGSW